MNQLETIHIYHTNDVHSHLEHWPRIHQFLAKRKKGHLKQAEDVFLFDIGDFVDRWHPFSEANHVSGPLLAAIRDWESGTLAEPVTSCC